MTLIDPFKIGDEIKVQFNLRGRKYIHKEKNKTMYFGSNNAWKIEAVVPITGDQNVTEPEPSKGGEDTLPF